MGDKMIVNMKDMLHKARKEKYAVPQFNKII
jgi:fructose/tagatose bisphosphate aldolase